MNVSSQYSCQSRHPILLNVNHKSGNFFSQLTWHLKLNQLVQGSSPNRMNGVGNRWKVMGKHFLDAFLPPWSLPFCTNNIITMTERNQAHNAARYLLECHFSFKKCCRKIFKLFRFSNGKVGKRRIYCRDRIQTPFPQIKFFHLDFLKWKSAKSWKRLQILF